MKKTVLLIFLSAVGLFAEVTTVVPYIGLIDYSAELEKSEKDSSTFGGVYASYGNLNYLLEFGYSHINSTYKNKTYESLNQDDISLIYSSYSENFMYKIGAHHIQTNDVILGSGNVFISTLGGYTFSGYDKYSYGLEGYFSLYNDIPSETGKDSSMSVLQFTPYFSIYQGLSQTVSNSLTLKLNYVIAMKYLSDDFLSFEISDTFYYRGFFVTLKAYSGEMRNGVKDGGMSVYNSLDVLKDGYGADIGYYLTKDFTLSVSYNQNNYLEYFKVKETSNSVAYATLSYSF